MRKDGFKEVPAAGLGGSEGGRRPTRVPPSPAAAVNATSLAGVVVSEPGDPAEPAARPDSQVLEKPVRRRFTVAYKLGILREGDACRQPGQLGALLRREGLYSSRPGTWRRQRDAGARGALAPKRRGRKPQPVDPLAAENDEHREHRKTFLRRRGKRPYRRKRRGGQSWRST